MPLITNEEYESMTLLGWVKFIAVMAIIIAILAFFSGCGTMPKPCMECLLR